jgi:anti-anti-sigma factor
MTPPGDFQDKIIRIHFRTKVKCMEIKISAGNARVPITIIHIKGSVDSATYQAFQAKADELIRDGARYILVDLTETPFVSSAGLRVLHNIFNQLRSIHKDLNDDELRKKMSDGGYKSPHLKVTNLSSQVKDAFVISGFDTYIEIHDDVKKAVASF